MNIHPINELTTSHCPEWHRLQPTLCVIAWKKTVKGIEQHEREFNFESATARRNAKSPPAGALVFLALAQQGSRQQADDFGGISLIFYGP